MENPRVTQRIMRTWKPMTREEYEAKLADIDARQQAEMDKPADERVNTCLLVALRHEINERWECQQLSDAIERECLAHPDKDGV
jgi:hypothetical protein